MQFENRINLNYASISKSSGNIKYMYRVSTGHKFIPVVADEAINYLVIIPLYKRISHEIGEALVKHVFCKHAPQSYFIFDKDQAFPSSVIQ